MINFLIDFVGFSAIYFFVSSKIICFSTKIYLPGINATYVLVIIAPGGDGTWQLGPY